MKRAHWFALWIATTACGGESPQQLKAYLGTTPKLDGEITPAEWADATEILGNRRLGSPVQPHHRSCGSFSAWLGQA